MKWHEVNFDGLVGPTHNYAGLAHGNIASSRNRNLVSNPKAAALQGLDKMRALFELGLQQAILPPQLRPDLEFLRSCGFDGSPEEQLAEVSKSDPVLLAAVCSAACMWTANAATVSPSPDTRDGKLHLTPANLSSGIHRSIEWARSKRVLSAIFPAGAFEVHSALPGAQALSDEGAANHMRFAPRHEQAGIEVFVHGRDAYQHSSGTARFPARQTLQAAQAVARTHQLDPSRTLHWKQNQVAIDHGAFHNDVVAVSNENVLLCHELAFENQNSLLQELKGKYQSEFKQELCVIEVSDAKLGLTQAVDTYLFNSQLVSVEEGMVLVAPVECQHDPAAQSVISEILEGDNPVQRAIYPDVKQSMRNGGGPACLRLRVLMNEQQLDSIHQGVRYDLQLDSRLRDWIQTYYRDELTLRDLSDPSLYRESVTALIQLESILGFEPGLLAD